MDELWSFVDDKGNKQWVWLAIDAETREIVGCYIGGRSSDSTQKLWESLPSVYRQCAVIYTISTHLIHLFFLANVIGQSVKKLERPTMLKDSTVRYDNEYQD